MCPENIDKRKTSTLLRSGIAPPSTRSYSWARRRIPRSFPELLREDKRTLCLCRRGVANRYRRQQAPALGVWAQASCNLRPCKPAPEGQTRSASAQTCGKDGEGMRKNFSSRAALSSWRQSVTKPSRAIPLRQPRSYANLSQRSEEHT